MVKTNRAGRSWKGLIFLPGCGTSLSLNYRERASHLKGLEARELQRPGRPSAGGRRPTLGTVWSRSRDKCRARVFSITTQSGVGEGTVLDRSHGPWAPGNGFYLRSPGVEWKILTPKRPGRCPPPPGQELPRRRRPFAEFCGCFLHQESEKPAGRDRAPRLILTNS